MYIDYTNTISMFLCIMIISQYFACCATAWLQVYLLSFSLGALIPSTLQTVAGLSTKITLNLR